MKFGKRIQGIAQENKRLGAYFVDYKMLKKFLKRIPQEKENNEDEGSDEEEGNDAQERFMLALESEVAKVESFFRSALAEKLSDFRSLCKRVNKLHLNEKVTDEFLGFEQLIALLDGSKEAELLKDFVAFSEEVDAVRSFVMTNAQAAVKITKKHDKLTKGLRLREQYVSVLHRCTFYNSRDFGALIADIEVLATQLIEKLTGRQPSADDFQCPICMHVLRNPLVLSCGHRFCNSCISVATYFKQHNCPVCRKDIVMDFQNLRVESLLSRFVRDLHEQKEVSHGRERGSCILEKPCNDCAQWRSLHSGAPPCKEDPAHRRSLSMASQPELFRTTADAGAQGNNGPVGCSSEGVPGRAPSLSKKTQKVLGLTVTPHYYSDTQQVHWTACADIFRTSSKQLLRVGSGMLSPSTAKRAKDESTNLTWSSKCDRRADENRRTRFLLLLAVVSALILGFGTGSLSSLLADSNKKVALYVNSSVEREASLAVPGGVGRAGNLGIPGGNLKQGGATGGDTCQGMQSGVEKLQEARTKSLHRALDNLVARSSKK
mmetsp:Transcript_17357/g.42097  ORF Transcript_17357/g.42097 Transcript_17357/m.42097 type:complete len:546 (+) Transcript_17357:73-1710(+)